MHPDVGEKKVTRTSFRRPSYKKKEAPKREKKKQKTRGSRKYRAHARDEGSAGMPWANQTLWPCTYTHTLTGDAAALQKTRSRLCWCLVCNCVCVCLRRGTRRRAHRESNAPARQCGAARPVTLGHPAGSLGTTSTLRDLQSFTRFHLQTYESGERGSGGKKKRGFLAVLRVSRSTTST